MDAVAWAKRLYQGCGMESEMLELVSLLNDLAEAYHGGDMTDEELAGIARKLCKTIVAHMASCNKDYDPEKCATDLVNAIVMTPTKGSFAKIRMELRRSRRGGAGSGSLGLI